MPKKNRSHFDIKAMVRLGMVALVWAALLMTGGVVWMSARLAHAYLNPARLPPTEKPADYGVPAQEISLHTRDGLTLAAWYTPPAQSDIVLLLGHGHGGHRMAQVHAQAHRLTGFGVLSWDFRAHGASQGAQSTLGRMEALDVQAAAAFARQRGASFVVAWGTSMGGAAVLWAGAHDPTIHMVVADSAYADLEALLPTIVQVPYLRPGVRFFLIRYSGLSPEQMRPQDVIAELAPRPVVLVHGERDSVIPVTHAYALYRRAREPKLLWVWPNHEHSQAFVARPEVYWPCMATLVRAAQVGDLPQGVAVTTGCPPTPKQRQ